MRHSAQEAGVITQFSDQKSANSDQKSVYVAPVDFSLPDQLQPEKIYMSEALLDEYRKISPGYFFARRPDNIKEPLQEGLQAAAAENCQFYIVPRISADKLKNFDNVYNISLEYAVYRVSDGKPVKGGIYSTSTFTITPFEALIHAAITMREESSDWLSQAAN
jgi:hypothetical protein